MVSSARLCLVCKGSRALCGNKSCPLLARSAIMPTISKASKDFFGPSYSVFVGRIGYPRVSIGPLAAVEQAPNIDNPKSWFGMEYSDVIHLRMMLLRSKHSENIHSSSRFVTENQELALASSPTDVEINFKKNPVYRVSFSDVLQPMGASASLLKMRLAGNPKIRKHVDRIVSDELKASQASLMLYGRGEDVYRITTILSSGALGMADRKKLVPTRWSITATDDTIFKEMVKKVKDFPSVNEFAVYSSKYLDNHFEILLMPGQWEYENFEAWAPGSFWSQNLKKTEILEEYEPYKGRTKYAELEGGGYYAARLGIIEGLFQLKRQARVVVFREVHEGYVVPLGVWVVRETVRNAFKNRPEKFETMGKALEHIGNKLRISVDEYAKNSRILKQRRLWDF